MASKVINYGLPHTRYTLLPAGHPEAAKDVIVGFSDVHYRNMVNQCGQENNISSS